MSIATQTPSAPPAARVASIVPPASVGSLDDLAALSPAALKSLYEGARVPVLADMDGPLVGRMLADPRRASGVPRARAGQRDQGRQDGTEQRQEDDRLIHAPAQPFIRLMSSTVIEPRLR